MRIPKPSPPSGFTTRRHSIYKVHLAPIYKTSNPFLSFYLKSPPFFPINLFSYRRAKQYWFYRTLSQRFFREENRNGLDASELGSTWRSYHRFRQIGESDWGLIFRFVSAFFSFFFFVLFLFFFVAVLFVLPFEVDHLEDQTVFGGRWHWRRHRSPTCPRALRPQRS